jgi:hypothetical protein
VSVAIVHRPRVQVPWLSIIVVLAIAVAAARAIVSGEMLATAPADAPAPLRRSNDTLRLTGEGSSSSRWAGIGRLEEAHG